MSELDGAAPIPGVDLQMGKEGELKKVLHPQYCSHHVNVEIAAGAGATSGVAYTPADGRDYWLTGFVAKNTDTGTAYTLIIFDDTTEVLKVHVATETAQIANPLLSIYDLPGRIKFTGTSMKVQLTDQAGTGANCTTAMDLTFFLDIDPGVEQ